ncbi:hypothetical protein ABPG72_005342 [Tetrahymena utriculariae]
MNTQYEISFLKYLNKYQVFLPNYHHSLMTLKKIESKKETNKHNNKLEIQHLLQVNLINPIPFYFTPTNLIITQQKNEQQKIFPPFNGTCLKNINLILQQKKL